MPRQTTFVVLALFATLLLFFGGAAYLIRFVISRDKELELENRLASIGASLALASEACEPGLAQELAIAYDPLHAEAAAKAGKAPLADSYLRAIEEGFDALLARAVQTRNLRSAALISSGGVVLASAARPGAEDEFLDLEDSSLLAMDWPLMEGAARTGQPAATLLYEYEGEWQKRVYAPWSGGVGGGGGGASASAGGGGEPLPILLRLEASADYLAQIEDIRAKALWVFLAGGSLLAGVGFAVLAAMRQLDRTGRELAKQDRLRSLGALASGMAHELRNPLGIMRLSVEELAEELRAGACPPETLAPIADDALEEIDRLAGLISVILAFARGEETGGAEGTCKVAEVAALCHRLASKSAPSAWKVSSNHDDPVWKGVRVDINGDALRQVLLNVLRNSTEALETAENGRDPAIALELRGSADGDMVELLVHDSGPGVPGAVAKSIFDPFYSSGKAEGTGLGLSISRQLLESAGGGLDLLPGAGPLGGATFVLRLPCCDPDGAEEETLKPERKKKR